MKRSSTYFKGLYLILLFELIGVLSCNPCPDGAYTIVGDGEIKVYHENMEVGPTDTIRGAFAIEMFANFEIASFHSYRYSPSVNVALATSCARIVANPIVDEDIQISINNTLMYREEELTKGANLLELEEVVLLTDPPHLVVYFSDEFVDLSEIPKGVSQFLLEYRTSDGLILSNQFDLNLDF